MGDWAHDAADMVQQAIFEKYKYFPIGGEVIVDALRKARSDALEHAAWVCETIHGEGEGTAYAIRSYKDNP